jgi:propionyl-CoA synthetase
VPKDDEIKGEVAFAFVVPKTGHGMDEKDIIKQIQLKIRTEIGAICTLAGVIVVQKLPKTRSGKILRGTIKKILNFKEYAYPATIDDPTTLDEFKEYVKLFFGK